MKAIPSQAQEQSWEGVETSWQAPETKGNLGKVKVWSRPQISSLTRAAKAVDGTHNLEVIGSNPVPATKLKRSPEEVAFLICIYN